jgi:outer membrane receptor protein involved in Fe transport
VIRDANGYITAVNAINLNTASFTVAGLDFEARYRTSLDKIGLGGALDFDVFWNHLFKQTQVPFPGADPQPELGQADCYSCGRLGSGFKNKVFGSVTFTSGAFSLNWRVRWYSSLVDSLDPPEDRIKIPAYTYHDMQIRWDVGEKRKFGLYFGMNNVFDKKPPIFADTNLVTWPGTQTVASTYDTLGRMFYAGVDINF